MGRNENLWGKIGYNSERKSWYVRGLYKGKQPYFSEYYSDLGPKTCKTKEEAEELQKFLSREIDRGVNILRYRKSTPLRMSNYSTNWLKKIKPTLPFSTYKTYRAAINNWIIPILGYVFLPDLNYDHYVKLWAEIPRSKKYRKNIITTVYTMMEDARRAGYIRFIPEKIVFKGKFTIPQKDIDWIDFETQEKILNEIPIQHRPIIKFIFLTGVRPSEARALHKSDLKLDKGYITIRYTFSEGEGTEIIKEVKQKKERRIPFYNELESLFKDMPGNLTPFVFINSDTGKPYTKNINRDIWNDASKKVLGSVFKLNKAGRHSWGNQMRNAGVDQNIVTEGLGHSDPTVTKKYYVNPNLDFLKKAVDNMRALH